MFATREMVSIVNSSRRRRLLVIRICLAVVILGLVVSGVTAFPLREELALARELLASTRLDDWLPDLGVWVNRVAEGLDVSYRAYPFIAYGTDWLAFAHLVIAVAFIGPLIDPIRNVWVTVWGLIACAGVVPLALLAGAVRGLPLGWQLIDISFGVGAAVPLVVVLVLTRRLQDDAHVVPANSAVVE